MSSSSSSIDPKVLAKLQGVQLFVGSAIAFLFGVQRAHVSSTILCIMLNEAWLSKWMTCEEGRGGLIMVLVIAVVVVMI